MEKGARDGKACGAIAFALNFFWLLFLFQDKKSTNLQLKQAIESPMKSYLLVSNFKTLGNWYKTPVNAHCRPELFRLIFECRYIYN